MRSVISFPKRQISSNDPLANLKNRIAQRYGVSLMEYIGQDGKRSPEVQQKIDRAMLKETMLVASKNS
ncbi:hypothetical protein [Bacillus sp. FSL K6-6540]|uniref:hypothetical protein n=1 Tax=Bacillus sp. FSL K6-6540 TaxID=2921512 RepID=UPI0030F69C77